MTSDRKCSNEKDLVQIVRLGGIQFELMLLILDSAQQVVCIVCVYRFIIDSDTDRRTDFVAFKCVEKG